MSINKQRTINWVLMLVLPVLTTALAVAIQKIKVTKSLSFEQQLQRLLD